MRAKHANCRDGATKLLILLPAAGALTLTTRRADQTNATELYASRSLAKTLAIRHEGEIAGAITTQEI
jgi:hypothetical protein